jgi:hypothetical protein
MTRNNETHDGNLVGAFGRAWNHFWFTPADPLPCSVLRIFVGLLALVHFACLGIELERWFSREGLLPPEAVNTLLAASSEQATYRYSYLDRLSGAPALWVIHAAAMIAASAFTVGLFTRLGGLFTLISVLAYIHRIPQLAGLPEPVLVFLLAYLCLAPAGARLSIDSLLWQKRAKHSSLPPTTNPQQPSVLANIALRLIQVHLAMFYVMMAFSKLYGDAWWSGDAIWLLLAQTESRPLDLTSLRQAGQWGEYLLNFWTLAIMYFELAFPVLIWIRPARPLLVALSVIIWVSLILATGHLLFGLTMIVATTAFLPAEFFRPLLKSRFPAATTSPAIAR